MNDNAMKLIWHLQNITLITATHIFHQKLASQVSLHSNYKSSHDRVIIPEQTENYNILNTNIFYTILYHYQNTYFSSDDN